MKFLLLSFLFVTILINKIIYKKIICFPTMITLMWCVCLIMSLYGFFGVYVPSNNIVYYSLIFLTSLNIFSIFFNKIINEKKESKYEYVINHQLINLILIVCIILLLFFCRKSIYLFIKTLNFDLIRNMFINYETIGEHLQVFIYITIIPIGKACMILSVAEYSKIKKVSSSLLLSIFFLLLCSLLTGGRSYLFLLVLIFIFSLYINNKSILRILKKYKRAAITVILMIIVMIIITSKRGFGDGGIFKSIYVYFCGGFSLFNTYIKNNLVFNRDLLYGKELVDGLFFPIIEILRFVFELKILPGNYILAAEATSRYMGISPSIAINASPTALYFAIRDFGLPGLIIYPFIISLFYTLFKRKNKNGTYLNKANYIYYLALCSMLTMSFPFDSFKNVGVFIYLLIICRLFKKQEIVK